MGVVLAGERVFDICKGFIRVHGFFLLYKQVAKAERREYVFAGK